MHFSRRLTPSIQNGCFKVGLLRPRKYQITNNNPLKFKLLVQILMLQWMLYDQVSNYLDKTVNFSCTRKNFFRQIFGFQIVLYGGCDGGSCKKFQKKIIFVPFLGAS